MGWFWADAPPAVAGAPSAACPIKNNGATVIPSNHPKTDGAAKPPPACPMHNKIIDVMAGGKAKPTGIPTAPPAPEPASKPARTSGGGFLSQINPLNYMFRDLSQERALHQTVDLPTEREESSIPRGDGQEKWEYPSPQQMYNALLRKGYEDTDVTAIEQMVAVHNFLNEGAWDEILGWEARFAGGLWQGWRICRRGEERAAECAAEIPGLHMEQPTLIRFQGRPGERTPKATLMQCLGAVFPDTFGTEPPFDRHDWYVSRKVNGEEKQVRYVIDYYSAPPEPTGEPVFYLDVRPSFTPTGATERLIRWGTDTWWRASGGETRLEAKIKAAREAN